jgi:hypothetical protein
MRFLTRAECAQWMAGVGMATTIQKRGAHALVYRFPEPGSRYYALCRSIATSITCRMPCLLWMTEWAVWPSSENLHLYYRVRQSYGDQRLLHEAPGHLFLAHEVEDLTTFLHLSMLFGWGGFVLPQARYVRVFFSHDEFVELHADDAANLESVKQELSAFALEPLRGGQGGHRPPSG